jgi:hypothetical protein
MTSTRPLTETASFRGQLSSSLERPLWWAVEQLGLWGDGHASASYEHRWKSAQGSYVHLGAVKVSTFALAPTQTFTEYLGGRRTDNQSVSNYAWDASLRVGL